MSEIPGATRPAALHFVLPCELKLVRQAAQTAHRFLAEQGCDEEILTACDLALVEGCNNAIKYAPENARTQPVGVEILCDATQIELRVTDHTRGFEWPWRIELPDPESESGRGLYLMQSLMDSASYLRGAGENVLVLRKTRPPGSAVPLAPKENAALIESLLEELSSSWESLSAIFRYGAEQGKISDLEKFARRLFSDLSQIVGAEWFVFREFRDGMRLDVLVASETSLESAPLTVGAPAAGEPLEVEAARSRRAGWFDERHNFAAADPLRVKASGRGFIHPVCVGDNLIGLIAVGKNSATRADPVFTAGQTNVIATFAHFLALQIVSARLREEQVASRLVARELEIAGSIQRSLLLKELPPLPGFELAASCLSANQVGGDFYDVLKIDDDAVLLVIADVMGKGILAAMFAAILRTVLRAAPELTRRPAALLKRVNELLFEELSELDMFITAQLVFVEAGSRRLVVASAGHCPVLVADAAGVKSVSPEGMPLGILRETAFADETMDLPANCRVLLYTDGVTEALNPHGERYGQERLVKWLHDPGTRGCSAAGLKELLTQRLAEFRTKPILSDDQTFVIMTG